MKKHLLSLGICLALLQMVKPAEAQTMASAKASTSVSHADERQPAEALPALSSRYNYSIKAVKSESGFEQGDILISPGISFGAVGFGSGVGGSGFLPLLVSAEYSINDKFAVGPYLGFYSRSYSDIDYKWTSFSFGAKGTLHATGLLNDAFDSSMDAEKIDLYASTYLGLRTYSVSGAFIPGYVSSSSSEFNFGLTIGGRYFFNPNIGAFLELGYGAVGVGTLGVSFRL